MRETKFFFFFESLFFTVYPSFGDEIFFFSLETLIK